VQKTARQLTITRVQTLFLTLVFGVGAASQAAAQEPTRNLNIKIKNFGQMDERFYRGAQPKEGDYKDLAALGVKMIIDLRDDAKSYARQAAEAAGLQYINIPFSDTSYPKEEQVAQFLKIVEDPATGPFYVHCAGGRHRTGIMGAVYRFNHYRWNYDQVYKEMKAYDFYTRWGHGAMKDFVQDYWQRVQEQNVVVSSGESNPKP
jgi:protein tyrosine/serine phosphatase